MQSDVEHQTSTRGLTRLVSSAGDRWPLEMRAETAALYCDEPSVAAFKAKVDRGVYCEPVRGSGILPKWHRKKLDRDIARRHSLQIDGEPLIEDATGLIA
jgi:hypothetical protein